MADLKSQIEFTAKADGLESTVAKSKKTVADLGDTVVSTAQKSTQAFQQMGKGGDSSSQKIDAATRSMINSIQRTTAALEAGSKTGSDYFRVLAGQRGVDVSALKPYLDQLDAVSSKQKDAGISTAQWNAAMRGVPAQFTDIVVALQGGQRPMTVLLQQGGQLKDMFGGLGPAAKALGVYVTGLLNPLTLSAAAVAALVYAYHQGSSELPAFNKALLTSGNAIGLTADQLNAMAERTGKLTGNQHAAADALVQFAANSTAAGDNIERFSALAEQMEKITGQAVSETVKEFAELGKSPVEASLKLNETTNYLTTSVYQQIKALEEQGKTSQAAALAQKAYADAMEARLPQLAENLGTLERAWNSLSGTAKRAWDAMLNIGRQQTVKSQLDDIASEIEKHQERLEKLINLGSSSKPVQESIRAEQQRLATLKDQQYALQENSRLQGQIATRQKESAVQTSALAQWDKDGDQFLSKTAQMNRELEKARNEGQQLLSAGIISLDQYNARLADIRKKYGGDILQLNKAKLSSDIDAIKQGLDSLTGNYANAEKIMEASHAAGMMSDSEYYEAKREFINLNEQAQEAALRKEIARYQQEKLTGADAIENQRKIQQAQAQLVKLREDATAKQQIVTEQEIANQNKLTASYLSARQAAQAYFDTQERQQQRTLNGLGKGDQQRSLDAGLNQIEDRYAQQRLELENQRALLEAQRDGDGNSLFNASEQEKYQQRLQLINEFQSKSLESYRNYYDELTREQGNWQLGFQEGLQNYLDTSRNMFAQTRDLVGDAFKGMEDAEVNFVKTGKANFSSLADSVINDLIRIQLRSASSGIFQMLGTAVASYFGGAEVGSDASSGGYNNLFADGSIRAHADGGLISGPGTSTSDSIPARLSNGEYVIKADAVSKVGVSTLDEINSGRFASARRFASGGYVAGSGGNSSATDPRAISVAVSVDARGTSVEGSDPQSTKLGQMIGVGVRTVMLQELRPGGLLAQLSRG